MNYGDMDGCDAQMNMMHKSKPCIVEYGAIEQIHDIKGHFLEILE